MQPSFDPGGARWNSLAEHIAAALGLHFPPARQAELQRRMAAAADALGDPDLEHFVDHLLSLPLEASLLRQIASHLTVGETYFFREPAALDALRHSVLPELIERRRGNDQRLRIWSAGCASGEEAYTLAILLHEAVPDHDRWRLDVIATDLNADALGRAETAIYGPWSFRAMAPELQQHYFERGTDGRHKVRTAIRRRVRFAPLNLVRDPYPAEDSGQDAPDIIVCRNVLMYLAPAQVPAVIDRLYQALSPGGWLVVSSCETSATLFHPLEQVTFPGALLYRKVPAAAAIGSLRPTRRSLTADPVPPPTLLSSRRAMVQPSLATRRQL